MKSAGMKPDQGTYLALARREALLGNPQAALQLTQECIQDGKLAQLRMFHPAQVGYCLSGDVAQLHHIDSIIASHRLDNTEYEFARLLEGIAAAGTYEQMKAVLVRMQSDMNQMSPETAGHITSFFEKNAAAQQAFAPADQGGCRGLVRHITDAGGDSGGEWRWRVVQNAEVAEDGRCEAAGGTVKVIDLEDEEWDAFAKAIAELARKNMGSRAGDFDAYTQWYERNGPYDIMVDAANVAFFGQNREGGGFNWRQVQHMYEMLRQRFPNKKILVMVHRKRVSDAESRAPGVQEFIERLRRARSFYHTPPGANDDWFWMYASVRAKHNGLLISNDELRDHIFSLLRPRHFLKWKERHIAHYRLSSNNPGYLSTQLEESGAWVLPVNDGTWRCVVPERA
ncbi:hypothetical protein VOLCADRAFT_120484 [Volvox carteri f. nagariensis]|uniref:Mitochondrial ribonuclease P catalytic subunit n=1 Tax=Volvox carteri f. nagariensis TaxID=3068 RepID=D8TMB4_VOLCA|nr:uncharacterized protein VOLCADRAFT_120484 [Volvox carteri f. nagariensis]EFJ51613.1 hypothetical protein VOLCADRAFT_120484 [Volvox carteri f. nagariensis]|eukprot:XP_002947565.1 hypothetical protein VOLCADRAFT_120484 [Volvox carteri f. nagariensis]